MFPLGLNFNNQISNNFLNIGFNCLTMPDMFQVFNSNSFNNVDNFCNSMMTAELQRQNEFFMILAAILANPNINHTPTIDLDSFVRPYDYNKYQFNDQKFSFTSLHTITRSLPYQFFYMFPYTLITYRSFVIYIKITLNIIQYKLKINIILILI